MTTTSTFETSPLVTPERIAADPHEAFREVPRWAAHWAFAQAAISDLIEEQAVVVVVGHKHRAAITLSPLEFALLSELTRCGHTVVTNTNGKRNAIIYAKLSWRDAPHDNMPVSRLIHGAGLHEAVKAHGSPSDLRADNLYAIGEGKPEKDARAVARKYAERLAKEREAGGTLPPTFDLAAYLENIARLFDAIDRHRASIAGIAA